MSQLEVLILELRTVNRLSSGAFFFLIIISDHEILYLYDRVLKPYHHPW